MKPCDRFRTFEHVDAVLSSSNKSIRIIIVYRPPPSEGNRTIIQKFLDEFTNFLEELAVDRSKILIAGDFNFHVDDQSDGNAKKFLRLLDAFDYTQFVKDPTHKHGHTLDLLITRFEDNLVHKLAVPNVSDHGAVRCKIMLAKQPFQRKEIKYRSLKRIDMSRFREDIQSSCLSWNNTASLEELVERYDTTLIAALDNHAPVKKRIITLRPSNPLIR